MVGHPCLLKTIQAIRALDPKIKIEVLIPDFQGDPTSLEMVLKEGPDVLNHNIETIARLYPEVRPQADYKRSLDLLKKSKENFILRFSRNQVLCLDWEKPRKRFWIFFEI